MLVVSLLRELNNHPQKFRKESNHSKFLSAELFECGFSEWPFPIS
jgi:hypothetical protein